MATGWIHRIRQPLAAKGRVAPLLRVTRRWFAQRAIRGLTGLTLALLGAWFTPVLSFSEAVTTGYRDFRYGDPVKGAPTAEKPESKLWRIDNQWWGSVWDTTSSRYEIHRFDPLTQSWTSADIPIDDRNSSKGDALWDGQRLYVASHVFASQSVPSEPGQGARLYRYSYDPPSQLYTSDPGFPVNVNQSESETLVLDKDSNGQLWITWVESGKVKVNRTLGDDLTWGQPFNLPVQGADATSDDISSVIAFGGDRIGIMWSNQSDHRTYFAVHLDSKPDSVWEPREEALADGVAPVSDDHINLKTRDGEVYAVTKTGLGGAQSPLIYVLRRDTVGVWSRHVFGRRSDAHTRPILLIDVDDDSVHVVATSRATGRGVIYRKSAGLSDLVFPQGLGTPFLESVLDSNINDPTSTKQNVTSRSGYLVLASDRDTDFYLHNYVGPTPTTTVLVSDPNPSTWASPVELTATVTPGTATGTVEFFDRGSLLGTAPLSGGMAVLALSTLAVGNHALRAEYSGGARYVDSASDTLIHNVTPAVTASFLEVNPNPADCGEMVTLTATVTPATASGTVEFRDGATLLGTRTLSGGVASLVVPGLAVGSYPLTTTYKGDAEHEGSVSDTVSQVVQTVPTTIELGVTPKNACGSTVSLAATVTPAGGMGTVEFFDDTTSLGTSALDSSGVGVLSPRALSGGTHRIHAVYGGDACHPMSASDTVVHEVNARPSQSTLASDPNPSRDGTVVTLTATVKPAGAAGGMVEFFDDTSSLGKSPLDSLGSARLMTSSLSVGKHSLTAVYEGDECTVGSSSAPYGHDVVADLPPTVRVDAPNGGDTLLVGTSAKLAWTASDDNGVTAVDLRLSRDNGANFEVIATGLPNDGTWTWMVTGPGTDTVGTPVFSALLEVRVHDGAGNSAADTSDAGFAIHDLGKVSVAAQSPPEFRLDTVTPNPSTGSMRIEYSVPVARWVRLSVLDIQGREVAVLLAGVEPPGRRQAVWDGRTRHGSVAAGLYFIRLQAGGRNLVRRVIVTR